MGEKTSHGRTVWLLPLILLIFVSEVVHAGERRSLRDVEIKNHLKRLNKPAVKTIRGKDGDIIDCVDIYKQPAFDHPLLKNHTIQMRPSNLPKADHIKSSSLPFLPSWHRNESCPKGTVPILRVQKSHLLRAQSLENFGLKVVGNNIEFAHLVAPSGWYHGAKADINSWNPHVDNGAEFSSASITVINNYPTGNIVEAGVMVNPQVFGDYKTRLFAYWTADASQSTGCYNVLCPGFVQVDQVGYLGGYINPVSTYGAPTQYASNIEIHYDPNSSQWWLIYGGSLPIGYWPNAVFKNMTSASSIRWGGEVLNTQPGGRHTTTHMGSGHFPREGFSKAAFFSNALWKDFSNNDIYPDASQFLLSKPGCYDMLSIGRGDQGGYNFFYGGPGVGPDCA